MERALPIVLGVEGPCLLAQTDLHALRATSRACWAAVNSCCFSEHGSRLWVAHGGCVRPESRGKRLICQCLAPLVANGFVAIENVMENNNRSGEEAQQSVAKRRLRAVAHFTGLLENEVETRVRRTKLGPGHIWGLGLGLISIDELKAVITEAYAPLFGLEEVARDFQGGGSALEPLDSFFGLRSHVISVNLVNKSISSSRSVKMQWEILMWLQRQTKAKRKRLKRFANTSKSHQNRVLSEVLYTLLNSRRAREALSCGFFSLRELKKVSEQRSLSFVTCVLSDDGIDAMERDFSSLPGLSRLERHAILKLFLKNQEMLNIADVLSMTAPIEDRAEMILLAVTNSQTDEVSSLLSSPTLTALKKKLKGEGEHEESFSMSFPFLSGMKRPRRQSETCEGELEEDESGEVPMVKFARVDEENLESNDDDFEIEEESGPTTEQLSKVLQFLEFTQCRTEDYAVKMLKMSNWDVLAAVSTYLALQS